MFAAYGLAHVLTLDYFPQLPSVPQSSVNKRKWAEPSQSAVKAARVEDGDDGEAGPSRVENVRGEFVESDEFAPGNDADYFVDEDEEGGRFFGGGLTSQQKRILELMNSEEDQEGISAEEELKNLRKAVLRLERAITKNQEQRVKFGDDPSKFIESEADLHDAIRALVVVTTNPALLYPELLKQGTPASLCSLMTHENIDISASVIELLEEMTDDDALDAGLEARTVEQMEEGMRKGQVAVEGVLESLLEHSFVELVIQTLPRLDSDPSAAVKSSAVSEANAESDAAAIYHVLGIVENLVSLRSALADTFLGDTTFLTWISQRISQKSRYDQNKGYAGELLSILLQAGSSEAIKERAIAFGNKEGVETLLRAVSSVRKHVPHDGEEREFVENLFDALCSALLVAPNRKLFLAGEGMELMSLIMKNKGFVRLRALKVMKHAIAGPSSTENCQRFIECQGLKWLFSAFMRGDGSHDGELNSQEEAMLLEIMASLLNNLPSESTDRIRFISKFVEKEYEKLDRLVEIRASAQARLQNTEQGLRRSQRGQSPAADDAEQEERDMEAYLTRLDGGLFVLQLTDYVLAWLVMEDDGIAAHVRLLFDRRAENMSFEDVVKTLQEYYENVGEDVLVAEAEQGEEPLRLRQVIVQLVNYLLSVL